MLVRHEVANDLAANSLGELARTSSLLNRDLARVIRRTVPRPATEGLRAGSLLVRIAHMINPTSQTQAAFGIGTK